jgi:phage terminase small subunit
MDAKDFIPIFQLCEQYSVEVSFFHELNEIGLIEIRAIENTQYLHQDSLNAIERIIRLHRELNVNPEGIDVVLNLLEKVDHLKNELLKAHNRLRRYEDDY